MMSDEKMLWKNLHMCFSFIGRKGKLKIVFNLVILLEI